MAMPSGSALASAIGLASTDGSPLPQAEARWLPLAQARGLDTLQGGPYPNQPMLWHQRSSELMTASSVNSPASSDFYENQPMLWHQRSSELMDASVNSSDFCEPSDAAGAGAGRTNRQSLAHTHFFPQGAHTPHG